MSCLTGPAGVDPSGTKGRTSMANETSVSANETSGSADAVGGVDSHQDTIHVAVITGTGRPVDDQEFPTTEAGYRHAVEWLAGHGPLQAVGVEGTSSYGAGICAALSAAGVTVVEANRTRAAEQRKRGKTDPLDAYRAARSVLSGEAATDPKRASIEPLRALNVARRSAVKAKHAAWRQIGALLVNAPPQLRDRLRDLSTTALLAALAATRPGQTSDPDDADTLFALRGPGPAAPRPRRGDHRPPGTPSRPRRRRQPRPDGHQGRRSRHRRSAADHRRRQPRPAAVVGLVRRTVRHRAHPRQLWTHRPLPALPRRRPRRQRRPTPHRQGPHDLRPHNPRLPRHPPRARLDQEGRLPRTETRRSPRDLPSPRRSLTQAAQHFAVWPMHLSTLDRGTRRDDSLATAYREWLPAA